VKLRAAAAAIALAATFAQTGCGFRLAGSEPLPAVMARPFLQVQDSYTDFARAFERRLQDSGAQLQPVGQGASAIVEVTRDEVQRRVLSVSARNIPTEYELTYTVIVAVRTLDKELMPPQTLSLTRDYSFDENNLLAKEHEEDVLRVQMARELAAIATRRLASLKSP
jgi:LPS-assembly lipoprotein